MNDLLKWRKEFPILEKTVYLINNSLGAMPRAVYDNLKLYADIWSTRGIRAWEEGWWEFIGEIGNILADIINAPKNTISMHQNVTIAEAVVLSCFNFQGKQNKIVYSDMNFPSVMYLYQAQIPNGAKIQIVRSEDGITVPTEKMVAAIDDETLLVPISHVLFKSAYIQDVEAIIEKAHQHGAHVVLDTYQSVGTVPVDVQKLNVDFVVGGSIKWLCGGPGAAYLYVRSDLGGRLQPKLTGWMAHQMPFAFEPTMRFTDNIAFKFLNGTPHLPALYTVKAGYEIIRQVGVENIRRRSVQLTERIIQHAQRFGFKINSPLNADQRGGTVVVQMENSQQIAKELLKRDFLIDWRPNAGIRISPHFYNTEDEVDAIMEEIWKLSNNRSLI
ncbi:MAG: aminotransferase class V-fold PLP-dependent enzyme [candidate division KSB1 bacterium]|nr:aminotransferase class V-fold PLP-dependent enzyme [candidate division KSB1 bacterium]MDZ7334225.1 aminotransferase class V-fold PLP-dependent enzyme [candidate division KSB1 bacterium]MDZ7358449.1 aminotransferase class V-fold PLP-dependent enzyme [candidate division KSB1 bacterium]MDZ7401069.1 aminotransferase class V-fold PLP-dependent enzyme [candidate division KSB1 bacterium]